MAESKSGPEFEDQGRRAGWLLELSAVLSRSAKQRADAERQRDCARSMCREARAMRERVHMHWPRAA